jgi:hypothetical protein
LPGAPARRDRFSQGSVIVDGAFLKEGRDGDEQVVFAVAAWLQRTDQNGSLGSYFNPPLTPEEREVAVNEGWILGVVSGWCEPGAGKEGLNPGHFSLPIRFLSCKRLLLSKLQSFVSEKDGAFPRAACPVLLQVK